MISPLDSLQLFAGLNNSSVVKRDFLFGARLCLCLIAARARDCVRACLRGSVGVCECFSLTIHQIVCVHTPPLDSRTHPYFPLLSGHSVTLKVCVGVLAPFHFFLDVLCYKCNLRKVQCIYTQ